MKLVASMVVKEVMEALMIFDEMVIVEVAVS